MEVLKAGKLRSGINATDPFPKISDIQTRHHRVIILKTVKTDALNPAQSVEAGWDHKASGMDPIFLDPAVSPKLKPPVVYVSYPISCKHDYVLRCTTMRE